MFAEKGGTSSDKENLENKYSCKLEIRTSFDGDNFMEGNVEISVMKLQKNTTSKLAPQDCL